MSENLQEIIDRVKNGTPAPTDIQALAAAIQSGQVTLATGQQAVAISGSAAESIILTGSNNQVNRICFMQDERLPQILNNLVDFLHNYKNTSLDEKKNINTAEEKIEMLFLEPKVIERINSCISKVFDFRGQLDKSQRREFELLQNRIQALNILSHELLEETEKKTLELYRNILKEIEYRVDAELLIIKSDKALDQAETSLNKSSTHIDLGDEDLQCIEQQLTLIRNFRQDLEDGRKVSQWLHSEQVHLAEIIGQFALNQDRLLEQAVSSEQVEDFYFTIEQFLERLSHCLIWGRSDVLKSPDIPKIFDDAIYSRAFNYLRLIIPNRLPNNGIEQLNEYIDCLLESLPLYESFQN